LLIFIVSSSATISVICVQLASTKDFAMLVPFLLTTLNQVYLLCYFGQKLHDSSLFVFEGISDSEWFAIEEKKSMKVVSFLMQQSQKPKMLKAHNFSVINLSTFMGVSDVQVKIIKI
jgi:gustatory receptor